MLFISAITSLQVGLFGAVTAVAAAEPVEAIEPVEAALEEVSAADLEEAEVSEEADPDERTRRWQCWDYGEREKRGWCLARCTDSWRYTPVTGRMRVRGNRDYCRSRARKYCRNRYEHVRDWCFGERD